MAIDTQRLNNALQNQARIDQANGGTLSFDEALVAWNTETAGLGEVDTQDTLELLEKQNLSDGLDRLVNVGQPAPSIDDLTGSDEAQAAAIAAQETAKQAKARQTEEAERSARIREDERKAIVNNTSDAASTFGLPGFEAALSAARKRAAKDTLLTDRQREAKAQQEARAEVATATEFLGNFFAGQKGSRVADVADKLLPLTQQLHNLVTPSRDEGIQAAHIVTTDEAGQQTHDFAGQEFTIQNTYQDVCYQDKLSKNLPPNEPEELIGLPNNRVVRYAEGEAAENEGPVFLIDALVWVQGTEISQFIKGEVRIQLSGTQGNNEASFTLDNSADRFIWSERNLVSLYGDSAARAHAPYIAEFAKKNEAALRRKAEESNLNVKSQLSQGELKNGINSPATEGTKFELNLDPELIKENVLLAALAENAFNQQEFIKQQIFFYKANPQRNPKIRNPKNTLNFARYDLVPGRSVFNRMDPVRIFSLYPFRVPGKEYETETTDDEGNVTSSRKELWCPEFTGYIENVSIDDDDINGVSSITIDCSDLRQSVLRRMRTNYSGITTGLSVPLEVLGFAVGTQQGQDRIGAAQQFSETTDGFFNIKNTQFYDDIAQDTFGQPSPNKPLEAALREVLVENKPITVESKNRGVRGVEFGGNFFYDAQNWNQTEVRKFLQDWHKFTLFGPKRRPWTRAEVDAVGEETTTDGNYAPNKCRLWQLLPRGGSGPKNLADLSVAGITPSHDINWTNRMEVITNFVESIDYNFMVSPCGDLITEFDMGDFRPEDFGEFRDSFRIDKGIVSSQFGDEQDIPPAGLVVTRAMSPNDPNSNEIAQTSYLRTFVFSPYIAARYGIEIAQETLPFLHVEDKTLAQQRSVLMYQKMLSRSHALNMTMTYRPFILPNRPLHHVRRARIGAVVTTDKEFTLAAEPKGSVNVGLDKIRLFTGHYRSAEDFKSLNEVQRLEVSLGGQDSSNEAQMAGPDSIRSQDFLELQVFNTVASGESNATSARVPWGAIPEGKGAIAVLAPASGVYVLELGQVNPKIEAVAAPADDIEPETPATASKTADPPPLFKFPNDPLKTVTVKSAFGTTRRRPPNARSPHQGVDFVAHYQPVFAVDAGTVTRASADPGGGGNVVALRTVSGFLVQYLHLDDRTFSGTASFTGISKGDKVKAGDQIGLSGNTGHVSGPHLHMDLFVKKGATDNGYVDERAADGISSRFGTKLNIVPYLPSGNYTRPSGGKS